MKELETLKLYRGATSVIELDFTGFTFENNSYCQLTIKKKYNDDIVFQHDFDKPIKYYVTFKDEFTASLDDDKYKYDIMYMLNEERYPQCSISDIVIDEVVNEYKGEFNAEAVQVTEVLSEGAEVTQTIKVTTSNVIIASSNLQERTVIPTKEEQIVLAEDGFDGMSKVVVEAIPNQYVIPNLQEKEARVTAPANIFVHPDEEYDGLSFVNVIASVDTETKEVTPTKEVQNISRSDGKYIDSVTVNAIPDNYIIPTGELEINENGSYDVTDKAGVKVETSGADLSEYFMESITGSSSSFGAMPYAGVITKLPAFKNEGNYCGYLFYYLKNLKEVDLSNFDTTNVTYMEHMFNYCESLENIDLSNITTDNVTAMRYIFSNCKSLKELNVNHFNTSKITDFSEMFGSCETLTSLNLSNWSSENVSSFQGTFRGCKNLVDLDISNFSFNQTKSSVGLNGMFSNCVKLKNVNWGNLWNLSPTNFTNTFSYCISLETLPLINMEKVTGVGGTFIDCTSLTNIGGFKDLGKAYTQASANYKNYTLNLSYSKALTHDSLMSVINGLYDLNLTYDVANGGTLYTQQLVLGATNLAKLTDEEKAIATNKGWTLS